MAEEDQYRKCSKCRKIIPILDFPLFTDGTDRLKTCLPCIALDVREKIVRHNIDVSDLVKQPTAQPVQLLNPNPNRKELLGLLADSSLDFKVLTNSTLAPPSPNEELFFCSNCNLNLPGSSFDSYDLPINPMMGTSRPIFYKRCRNCLEEELKRFHVINGFPPPQLPGSSEDSSLRPSASKYCPVCKCVRLIVKFFTPFKDNSGRYHKYCNSCEFRFNPPPFKKQQQDKI